MSLAKYQTTGPVTSAAKMHRITVKDQEVSQLMERVEDLETCIAVNMQLMQEVASVQRSGEDTDPGVHVPNKLLEKLIEQKRLLESAIEQTRAQKTLCNLKITRSESDTCSAQQSEARAHADIFRQIALARKDAEDKERTIQSLEGTLAQLEKEFQLCQSSKIAVVDLPGTALRIERLTRAVRQDDQLTLAEKLEEFEKCKALELQLAPDRTYFGREFHSRSAVKTLSEEFGLDLTYENYLHTVKPGDVSEVKAAHSFATSLMEEAKREEVQKRHVKSKSEINVGLYVQNQEVVKGDSAMGKLEELFLASKLKSEELASLRRLSSYLDAQKALLTHKTQQLKVKALPRDPPSPPDEGFSSCT